MTAIALLFIVDRCLASVGDTDCSLQIFLARFQAGPAWRDAAAMVASYAEGFNAADTSTMSVQALLREQRAAAASDGDRAFRIAQGYDHFMAALAASGDPARVTIHLDRIARHILWQRGHVEIHTEGAGVPGSRSFAARHAVITLPLGFYRRPRTHAVRYSFICRLPIMLLPRASWRWGQWSR
jgi:hypothetical protein